MLASVVIPSYNGEKKISETLEALCRQSVNDFETIVVLDGSTDNTLEILKGFENKLSRLIAVNQPNGGRARARNKGASISSSDILIFIDDDIEVMPKNIETHMMFHQKQAEATLVGNPSLNSQRIGNNTFLKFRADAEQRWAQKHAPGINPVSFSDYVFTTQNMSLRKDLFVSIGKFDERLTDSEDFDLSVRLLQANKPIFFNTDLTCYHNDFTNLERTIERQTQYYRSKMELLKLHPEYKELLPLQFEWLQRTQKDTLKSILFKKRSLWESFFRTRLFSFFPTSVKNAAFSSLIYVHSVLIIKK